jgi:formamidopyrimidine-DNA glycosylase
MPELPEVETVVRRLRKPLVGRTITAVRATWANSVPTGIPHLERALPKRKILSLNRRGKYLKFDLSGGYYLFIHLKMSGDLEIEGQSEAPHPHDRTVFQLDNKKELRFRDPRKFGRVYLVKNESEVTGKLGPEPLTIEEDSFLNLFKGKKGRLKPLLLNQEFIVGIGNIYADESCFQAGINPKRKVQTLKKEELQRLLKAIKQILGKAIKFNGSTFDFVYRGGGFQNHFKVYDRKDEPCKRCKTPIKRIILGSRSTHFCPKCQR